MIEYIMLGGLMLLLGLYVGRHIGRQEGKQALIAYMQTVNTLHNIMQLVHEKHGIADEVAERLREHGIEVRRIRIGGGHD